MMMMMMMKMHICIGLEEEQFFKIFDSNRAQNSFFWKIAKMFYMQ